MSVPLPELTFYRDGITYHRNEQCPAMLKSKPYERCPNPGRYPMTDDPVEVWFVCGIHRRETPAAMSAAANRIEEAMNG